MLPSRPLHRAEQVFMGSKGRGYRTVQFEGFEILIGKGAEENDELTLHIADKRDFWLHVGGGTPGSHVVVRNPEGLAALPRPVLERAAELAAWHSKARGSPRVEVHFCRAADVSKKPGQPPGKVTLRRWDAVRVTPRGTDPGAGDDSGA